ncbi:hypothetical protein CQW44_37585 [Streptomyces griseofuscus]|uniref:DUF2637 domain-containing protein n=1 Tax=Streptomyces griseofuscus TaxID=146922 RepID=A0A3R8R6F0_9ACTN|nr:hypothetical protein CQW44_37585 [Streptomyces griseofuscus]
MQLNTQQQVDQAETVLRLSWVIVFGVILFSVFTVTPLVERSTPAGWEWSAPILPLVVDVAVVISIRVDAIVARLGGSTTGWPLALRVLTGGASVALNVGNSVLDGDWVGALVHTAAPAVLIVVAEASLKWRREIAAASTRIEAERREQEDARRREIREREERARADREREQEARREEHERQEAAERERRREEQAEREREREHAARVAREEREHAAQLEAAREDRADARHREEQERQARERKAEADRRDRERREQEDARKAKEAERDRKAAEARRAPVAAVSPAVSTPRPAVSATVSDDAPAKLPEAQARQAVIDGVSAGRSQREIAALTGWSTGWVAKRVLELGEAA